MSRVGAIILAAGMSSRMGQPKLLMTLRGKPMFRYPLESAIRNQLDPICLIGGQHIQAFQLEAAELQDVEFIYNPHYEKGMSSTLKEGIKNIKGRSDAAFIFLADQPFVPDIVIQSMLEQLHADIRVVRPQYQGIFGHPILIDNSLYDEFLLIEGDQGGKEIIKKYKYETRILTFEDSIWGMDIDSEEDYEKGKKYSSKTFI